MIKYNTDKEIWKTVPGYEGYYEVSNKGRVKSLPRNGTINAERIMKLKKEKNGYMTVHLRRSGYSKHKKVHRLVCKAFLKRVKGNNIVNHLDGDKENNNLINLEWTTHSKNTRHAIDTGLKTVDLEQLKKAQEKSVAVVSKPVRQMDLNGTFVREFPSLRQASLYVGVKSTNMIGEVCRGKREVYKGYKWEYADK